MIGIANEPRRGRLFAVHALRARQPEPRPNDRAWGVRNSDNKVLTFAAWAMFCVVAITLYAVFA